MTKIQELADQAKLSIPTGMYEPDAWIQEYNRRFAELIVQECIDIIDMTHGSKKLMRPDPYQKIIWAIEEHFGVER